jgi:hypothetical protein
MGGKELSLKELAQSSTEGLPRQFLRQWGNIEPPINNTTFVNNERLDQLQEKNNMQYESRF